MLWSSLKFCHLVELTARAGSTDLSQAENLPKAKENFEPDQLVQSGKADLGRYFLQMY